MTTEETSVSLTNANSAIAAAVVGAGIFGWSVTYLYFNNKTIQAEKNANIPPDQQTVQPWWVYLLLVIGLIMALGAFGGVYYKKKK
jgi:hypothetical protein